MIYFDNAATSFPKPQCVIKEVKDCLQKYCGNAGRSGHRLSLLAAEKIYRSRDSIAAHLCYPYPERVVFSQNATYALNLAIRGLITERCHIITSDIEHNSVIRPVHSLARELGCRISSFDADIDPWLAIPPLIRDDTSFIISTATSNVTGQSIDIRALSDIAKKHGLSLILDLSQTLGHMRIDASVLHFSALCAPGHKGLMGIQGCGFTVFSSDANPSAFIYGGSGAFSKSRDMPPELPERMEGGTLSTPAIVALMRGVEYLDKYGVATAGTHLQRLTDQASERLSSLSFVKVISANNGIVCFNVNGYSSEQVAARLDRRDIAVRGGLHCAPDAHKKLGTLENGAVRASFSIFNKPTQVDRFYTVLKSEFG